MRRIARAAGHNSVQDGLAALEIELAGLGQTEAAVVAIEQPYADAFLDRHHVLADHRGGDIRECTHCSTEGRRGFTSTGRSVGASAQGELF
jgi:hypothetical protein